MSDFIKHYYSHMCLSVLVNIKNLGNSNLAYLSFNTSVQNFQEYRKCLIIIDWMKSTKFSLFLAFVIIFWKLYIKRHKITIACGYPSSPVIKTFTMLHQLWSNKCTMCKLVYYFCFWILFLSKRWWVPHLEKAQCGSYEEEFASFSLKILNWWVKVNLKNDSVMLLLSKIRKLY